MSVKDGFSAGERHRIKHGMEYDPVSLNPYNKKDTPCAAIRLHKEYLQYNDRTTLRPKQVSGVFYQRSMEQLLAHPDADAGADD